jgi:hypothetical protein
MISIWLGITSALADRDLADRSVVLGDGGSTGRRGQRLARRAGVSRAAGGA